MKKIIWIFALLFGSSVAPAQTITTFAGTGYYGFNGDNIPATDANISGCYGLASDAGGNIYVAVSGDNRVRKIDPDGIITTIAGDGTYGFSGDGGPAVNAQLSVFVFGIFIDRDGNIYLCDQGNNRVRKIDTHGIITTIAGTGEYGYGGDGGPATAAKIWGPRSVCVDDNGNIYIADSGNDRIRKIDGSGMISTVAGTGEAGYNGDFILATNAKINTPTGLAFDRNGELYIADHGNLRIRKIDRHGIISTVAGFGIAGNEGDGGPATAAKFKAVHDIKFDKNNNFYFPDPGMNRVRKVSAAGIITTVAGCDESMFGGDGGPAIAAGLSNVNAVTLALDGSLLLSDFTHRRIRRVSNVVAVNETNAGIADISVFPNPNDGGFSVNLSANGGGTEVQVFDVVGRLIDTRQKVNGNEIKVELDAPSGQYVVVIRTVDAMQRVKVSVMR